MLTRLVIMASVDGIFSSREIMKFAEENMVYMYLSGWISRIFVQFAGLKLNVLNKLKNIQNDYNCC